MHGGDDRSDPPARSQGERVRQHIRERIRKLKGHRGQSRAEGEQGRARSKVGEADREDDSSGGIGHV